MWLPLFELPLLRVRASRGYAGLRQRRQVAVRDLLLAVGQRLERGEHICHAPLVQVVSEILEARLQRVLAGVLAEDEFGLLHPHGRGRHDLVGFGLGHDAVLMDAAFVREGVCSDDGLAGRDAHARDGREQMRAAGDLFRADARGEAAVGVAAGTKAHHDLLQCGIAGAFADSADRAFHLAGPGADSGKRVGHGKAEVVMAVRGHRRVSDALDAVHDGGDKRAEFVWRRIAYRVGYVDDRGAGGDGGLERLAEEVDVRSRRVFGRELHLAAELARVGHGVPYLPQTVGA